MNYFQPIQENTTNFFQYFLNYIFFCLILLESVTDFCIVTLHYGNAHEVHKSRQGRYKFIKRQWVFSELKKPVIFSTPYS